jgi:hypothetical protein
VPPAAIATRPSASASAAPAATHHVQRLAVDPAAASSAANPAPSRWSATRLPVGVTSLDALPIAAARQTAQATTCSRMRRRPVPSRRGVVAGGPVPARCAARRIETVPAPATVPPLDRASTDRRSPGASLDRTSSSAATNVAVPSSSSGGSAPTAGWSWSRSERARRGGTIGVPDAGVPNGWLVGGVGHALPPAGQYAPLARSTAPGVRSRISRSRSSDHLST